MKLNYKRTFLIGLAFMSLSSFWTFYDQSVPYLLKYVFGKEEVLTNCIMAIDNVLALFMLPLFGALSDRVDGPMGRRTPFVLFGTIAAVICLLGMALGVSAHNFWLFFCALFLTLVAMGTYRSPAVSLMPDLTPRPLRSKANAIINLMGALGGAFSLAASMVLIKGTSSSAEEGTVYDANANYWPIFVAIAAFMLLGIVIFMLTVKEKKLSRELRESGEMTDADFEEEEPDPETRGRKLPRPVLRSLLVILFAVAFWYMAYNGVTTSLSRYCREVMGKGLNESSGYVLVATIVSIAAFLPLGLLSSRFGRKKMIYAGVALMFVSFVGAAFIRRGTPDVVLYVVFALVGVGWSAINVNSYPMVVEISRGGDVGRYTGYYYTFSMAAQVFTPVLSAFFISEKYIGLGYEILFPYAALFMVLALTCMLFVRHGDVRPEAKGSLLEHFDVDD